MIQIRAQMMKLTGVVIAPWAQIGGRAPDVCLKPTCFAGYFRSQGAELALRGNTKYMKHLL